MQSRKALVGQTVPVLDPYRRVLAVPGAKWFSLSGFFGRLPISMVSLGIVLLVAHHTDSYAEAGVVSSAYLVANAVFAILHGRLVDRFGQFVVLTVAQCAYTAGLVVLIVAVSSGAPLAVTLAAAAATGASLPQVGACVRARWSHALADRSDIKTAFAFESIVDECLFIIGPTVVTVLATSWSPIGGIAVAAVCGLAGTLSLAAQRRTQPVAHARPAVRADRPRMPWELVAPLVLVSAALGTIFGVAEVTTVAFADEQGHPSMGGPLLGVFALGSLAAGVATGIVAWPFGPEHRVRWGILLLAVAMVPLALVDSLWVLGGLLLVAGMAIAPTLIATMEITEASVPVSRLTEGMAILHTAMGVGIAPGATLAGLVIDSHGAPTAYLVAAAAGLVGAAAAWSAPRRVASRA